MFHRPTELLWIGCLTGSIWTQKIQIRNIDSKHQIADIFTKGNFTFDEWNNLLHLFNVSHFSSTCCIKNFSLIGCSRVAKRIPFQKGEWGCVQFATSSDEYIFLSYVVKFLCRITKRPVSGQPTTLFSQIEEIDIDFRVFEVPHAVVKQAENFRVRELVKKILDLQMASRGNYHEQP